jgi:RNA polymerase sigma-70 factor (ECF subfamily)
MDKALVRRMAGGDRAALCILYRGHHAQLCRMLFQLTRRRNIIEEAIENCFWIAWKTADDLPDDTRVSTWLMGIAYRCCIDSLRYCPSSLSIHGSTKGRSPLRVAPRQVYPSHLETVGDLDALTIDQRVILELIYGARQTLEEVADIIGTDLGEVESKLVGARALL